ncbi:autophagy-related protein 2B-like protein, partial [Leptotrombidium deliense]
HLKESCYVRVRNAKAAKMPLNIPWLTEPMKKRALRYLLHHYLGHFLFEKLTLDQLSVDLFDGKGSISDIVLQTESLNEEFSFLPIQFVDGCFIRKISVAVPWSSLLSESCSLQVDGSTFICSVIDSESDRKNDASTLSKSLMTSSMQIAEDIVNEDEAEKVEGVEMFAQLIDSVLRRVKVTVTNTTFVVTTRDCASQKSNRRDTGVTFKVDFLQCEEQELPDNCQDKNRDGSLAMEYISKILTLEGVEVSIDGKCVCKLDGKHTIKVRANERKSDLQVNIGSLLFAVFTAEQLNTFLKVFGSAKTEFRSQSSNDKEMSPSDFARIEQQLQMEHANVYKNSNSAGTVRSMNLAEQNRWAFAGSFPIVENELQFLPVNSNDRNLPLNSKHAKGTSFTCYIKIPGILMCLLHSTEKSQPISLPYLETSFDAINKFLNKVLGKKKHIRCLALPMQIEIKGNVTSFICGKAMISEQTSSGLTNILSSEEQENGAIHSPQYLCEISNKCITLNASAFVSLTVDPTFVERFNDYISTSENSELSEYSVALECDSIKIDLLIPIPDLRQENERSASSSLRDEHFIFILEKFSSRTDFRTLRATAESCKGYFVCKNLETEVMQASSYSNELIELVLKRGPSASVSSTLEETIVNTLMEAEMEDSIYISTPATRDTLSLFHVKRKVIKEKTDESEHIISPSDQKDAEKFFDLSRTATQTQIDLTLPFVNVKIANKRLMELIYNRFGNDLVLWKPTTFQDESKAVNNVKTISPNPPTYFQCKSGLGESVESDASFHSLSGSPTNKMHSSAVCVINAIRATFEMGDGNDFQRIAGSKVFFGTVIGLEDDTSNMISLSGQNMTYEYNNEMVIGSNKFTNSNCSLHMSVDIRRENPGLKRVKFALQIIDGAMYTTNFDLFKNFWSFVDVRDEEVLGYIPPLILTEVHIDLVNGAIAIELEKVRPAVITFDDSYITSMVFEDTDETANTLCRFIVEEGSLYLKKNNSNSRSLSNYVCVIDSGLIDLDIKISDGNRIEFKATNNILNIRACSDSLRELSELFKAIASNGEIVYEDQLPCDFTSTPKCEAFPNEDLIQDALDESDDDLKSNESFTKNCDCNTSPESLVDESGFWILGDDDVGAGIKVSSEPQIRVLTDDPIKVLDNHFGKIELRPIPDMIQETVARYLLEEMSLVVNLYGGKDFEDTSESGDDDKNDGFELKDDHYARSETRVRFADSAVHLFESLDLETATGVFQPQPSIYVETSNKNVGGKNRHNDVCVQFYFSKVKILLDKFEPTYDLSWRFMFAVNNIEVRDRVTTSKINKMLYEYCSETMPRRNNASFISVKATSYRTSDNNEECDLQVSLKPLRINIDQDTIVFLMNFLNQFTSCQIVSTDSLAEAVEHKIITGEHSPDIDRISVDSASCNGDTQLNSLSFGYSRPKLYFKSFVFSPHVPIRLDYHGRRLDFEKGALQGILMGLAQLNQSELYLKRLHNKHGFLGIDRVLLYAVNEWTKDIKRHQLPSLLGGVGPMHSFIQLFQGVRDLFWMPFDQYRRDKRIVRGLQRGATSFSNSTAMAMIDLANRLLNVIEGTAQFAHDVVTPPIYGRQSGQRGLVLTSQPRDFREGIVTGLTVMKDGINETVRTVSTGMQADDVSEAIGNVVRQLPTTIIRPIIQVSHATSTVLVGMRNQMTPNARKEDQDKWKS